MGLTWYAMNYLEKLVGVAFDELGIHHLVLRDGRVQVLLQVHRQELEDEVQTVLLHDDVLEAHDVGVLQLPEKRDLTDGR